MCVQARRAQMRVLRGHLGLPLRHYGAVLLLRAMPLSHAVLPLLRECTVKRGRGITFMII